MRVTGASGFAGLVRVCLPLLLVSLARSVDCRTPRVAIIGSGVGGSGTAYYLKEKLPDVDIVVFEKNEEPGGRTHTIQFAGITVDTGATSVSTLNEYLVEIINKFNLSEPESQEQTTSRTKPASEAIGIWDGTAFVFQSSTSMWELLPKLFYRYGMSVWRMRKATQDAVSRLSQIYSLQKAGVAFDSPRTMFEELGLWLIAQQSAYDYFEDQQVSSKFLHEFADAASRCNYLQEGDINAVVDAVSLAGAGLVGSVFSLPKGTEQLPRALLKAAQVDLQLSARVTAVETDAAGFKVVLAGNQSAGPAFDAVVVATPLPGAHIKLPTTQELNLPEYQTVHVTLVAGILAKSYFGTLRDLPTEIFTKAGEANFNSIGLKGYTDEGVPVYKIFSHQQLSRPLLDTLFEGVVDIERLVWPAAYPKLQPVPVWPDFDLTHSGLHYLNAMESAISCMETELIAAKNLAITLSRRLRAPPPCAPNEEQCVTK